MNSLNYFPQDEDARRLSKQTFTLAEFLTKLDYQPRKLSRKALLHGHCHHKAILKMDCNCELLKKSVWTSKLWIPVAAAWPARSDSRKIVTMFQLRAVSGFFYRKCERPRKTHLSLRMVLVVANKSGRPPIGGRCT